MAAAAAAISTARAKAAAAVALAAKCAAASSAACVSSFAAMRIHSHARASSCDMLCVSSAPDCTLRRHAGCDMLSAPASAVPSPEGKGECPARGAAPKQT